LEVWNCRLKALDKKPLKAAHIEVGQGAWAADIMRRADLMAEVRDELGFRRARLKRAAAHKHPGVSVPTRPAHCCCW